MTDWESYVDLLVYGALDDLLKDNKSGALELYPKLLAMWDGNGFRINPSMGYIRLTSAPSLSTSIVRWENPMRARMFISAV